MEIFVEFSQHKDINNGLMLIISNKKGGFKSRLCVFLCEVVFTTKNNYANAPSTKTITLLF